MDKVNKAAPEVVDTTMDDGFAALIAQMMRRRRVYMNYEVRIPQPPLPRRVFVPHGIHKEYVSVLLPQPTPEPGYILNNDEVTVYRVLRPNCTFYEDVKRVLCMDVDMSVALASWLNYKDSMVIPTKPKMLEYMEGTREESGWRVLSYFLMGSKDNWSLLRESVAVATAQDDLSTIDEYNLFMPELNNDHLDFLSRKLNCRFGIYSHNHWVLVGEWKEQESKITFLMEHNEITRYYSIITELF